MSLSAYFDTRAHLRERAQLPLLRSLIDRYTRDRPLAGEAVVFGHLLVRNALVMVEALHRGGAQVTLARAHPSPVDAPVLADLEAADAPVHTAERAVERDDAYIDAVAVTGVPGAVGWTIPAEWLAAETVVVNIGAEDEFGPDVPDGRILGGRGIPLNFHLERPTLNRYIDPSLAAHLLALEALLNKAQPFPAGVHPLPQEMDDWIVRTWREQHPREDIAGIGAGLGISA